MSLNHHCICGSIGRIPLLRYLKNPVKELNDLYDCYPRGGQTGWFAYVRDEKNIAFWDSDGERWELLLHDVMSGLRGDMEKLIDEAREDIEEMREDMEAIDEIKSDINGIKEDVHALEALAEKLRYGAFHMINHTRGCMNIDTREMVLEITDDVYVYADEYHYFELAPATVDWITGEFPANDAYFVIADVSGAFDTQVYVVGGNSDPDDWPELTNPVYLGMFYLKGGYVQGLSFCNDDIRVDGGYYGASTVNLRLNTTEPTKAIKGQFLRLEYMGWSHVFAVEFDEVSVVTDGTLGDLFNSLAGLIDDRHIRTVASTLPWVPALNIQMPYFKGETVYAGDRYYLVTGNVVYATSTNQFPPPLTHPTTGVILLWDDSGYASATSLADFPVEKPVLVATLTGNGAAFTPAGGSLLRSMTIIVKNASSSQITQVIPDSGNWVSWDGDELIVPAGGLAEINIVKADRNYVMFKVKD
jgi:hypothetical protein